jgi:ribonuclease HI
LELVLGKASAEGVHLLAYAVRGGGRLRALSPAGIPERLTDRLQYAAVYLGQRRVVHLIQIYGHAEGDARAIEDNAQLVLAAAAFLRSLGDVPALIVGDLNMALAEAGVEAPLAMAGWTDVLAHAGPTCLPSHGAPSRIDYVLASRPARALICGAALRWDLGLAWHAALVIDLELGPAELTWMRVAAPRLDGPQAEGWPAARGVATATVMARRGPAFAAAVAAGNPAAAWHSLEQAAREWLAQRRGFAVVPTRTVAGARRCAESPRTTGGGGEAQQREADRALLRLRQLRSFAHAAKSQWSGVPGCLPHPARCILAALGRGAVLEVEWSARLEHLARQPAVALPSLIVQAEAEHAAIAAACRERRRQKWQEWVSGALEDGSGRVYRWIKGGGGCAAALVPDPAACMPGQVGQAAIGSKGWLLALRGGPAAQLRHLEAHWIPLWRREPPAALPEEWLAELDGLPPFPDRVPWSAALVRSLLRRMPRRKAVGLDGWSVAELRLLPDELLAWCAELLETVERTGTWPEALRRPEGLLLPKGGPADAGDPMERRPIWLLPMLYRLWAAGRAQLFAKWRSSWPGGDGGMGAEELAWQLALELEAAEAAGEDVCGAALDWRKAFDSVPLANLRPLLCRAGVPEWLLEPLLATYGAPRRLRVEGALGECWTPTSGILPGCALAVFVLSVALRPWDRRMEHTVAPCLRRRIYVDDLTLWARGRAGAVLPALLDGLRVTAEFAEASGWQLHSRKCVQFANSAAARRWLCERWPEIPVGTEAKDLGVVASTGRARRSPIAPTRVQIAVGRFRRVGKLPVPFAVRCRLGAAAGTAAAVYGAACGTPAPREITALRCAAKAAVCRGGQRWAAEVVFGVLSPSWRLDPAAVVALAPIVQFSKALRAGRLPLAEWRETAEALSLRRGIRSGPVAAALRSLAALGLGVDAECWTGIAEAPGGWRPAEHPVAESVRVLLQAWRRSQWRALARRRPAFAHLHDGADEWATGRLLRAGRLAPDAAGALRVVLAGGVITERVARRWSGRPPLCPHCGLEDEDAEHRHWRCPAWAAARAEALGSYGAATQLRRQLTAGLALTGIAPTSAELQALAQQAAGDDPQLPGIQQQVRDGPRQTVYSDGACVHPSDPLLARAAWGVHVVAVGGRRRALGGPVGGQQTAQRAEVTAALAAVGVVDCGVDLVSDSRYVVNGVAALAAGARCDEWRHADLWTQLAPHVRSGRLRARWTPAHLDAEACAARGLAETDRVGNAAADAAAGSAAAARALALPVVEARAAALGRVEAAQRVLALTELAALRANHSRIGHAAPRVRRRWGVIRRAPRPVAGDGSGTAGGPPVRRGRRSASTPPGGWVPPTAERVHSLFAGRAWMPHAAAQGPRLAACLRCGAFADGFRRLAATPCSGWAEELPARVAALMLLGPDLRCAGGPATTFDAVVLRRRMKLPAAPD